MQLVFESEYIGQVLDQFLDFLQEFDNRTISDAVTEDGKVRNTLIKTFIELITDKEE